MRIIFYADNGSMGDTSPADCDLFREWAEGEIEKEFPGCEVTVSSERASLVAWTDAGAETDDIVDEFCSGLWDSCPWYKM